MTTKKTTKKKEEVQASKVRIVVRSFDYTIIDEAAKAIVEKQFGYTFLPELATIDMESLSMKYVKSFQKPEPMREVSLITHRSFIKKRLINLLFNEIKAHIPPHLLDKNRGKIINI